MAMICTKICGFVNDASQTWIYELKFEGEDSQTKIRGQLFADKYSRTKNWGRGFTDKDLRPIHGFADEDSPTKIHGRSFAKNCRRRFETTNTYLFGGTYLPTWQHEDLLM